MKGKEAAEIREEAEGRQGIHGVCMKSAI